MGEDSIFVNKWGGVSLVVGSGYQRKVPSRGHADKAVRAPMKEIYQTNPARNQKPAIRNSVRKLLNEAISPRQGRMGARVKGRNLPNEPILRGSQMSESQISDCSDRRSQNAATGFCETNPFLSSLPSLPSVLTSEFAKRSQVVASGVFYTRPAQKHMGTRVTRPSNFFTKRTHSVLSGLCVFVAHPKIAKRSQRAKKGRKGAGVKGSNLPNEPILPGSQISKSQISDCSDGRS